MDQLLRESHIISLHVPLTPQSHHLINKDALDIMKQVHALGCTGHAWPFGFQK
jgi:lactate dehydrogenase-like 2-hydroxyacid dehydrogenase